jgi:hypothetical protein
MSNEKTMKTQTFDVGSGAKVPLEEKLMIS